MCNFFIFKVVQNDWNRNLEHKSKQKPISFYLKNNPEQLEYKLGLISHEGQKTDLFFFKSKKDDSIPN